MEGRIYQLLHFLVARVKGHLQGKQDLTFSFTFCGDTNTPGYSAQRLKAQCDNMRIQTLEPSTDTQSLKSALASSDVILDAIFGFSFKPPVRAPFDAALPLIANSGLPIVSVDVPSGWNVDEGKVDALALDPDVLISLTAPKEGVRAFKGRHFLGGRFVPKYVCCRIKYVCAAHWP